MMRDNGASVPDRAGAPSGLSPQAVSSEAAHPSRKEKRIAAVAVRMTPKVKAEIVAAADANGRSVAREIEVRLVESLLRDRFGDIEERVARLEKATFPFVSPQPAPSFVPLGSGIAAQRTKILFTHNSDIGE